MNENEFKQKMIKNNIPTSMYCINDNIKDDCHCILKNYNRWEVYYRERGVEYNKKVFFVEENAWDSLYERIKESFEFMNRMDKRGK